MPPDIYEGGPAMAAAMIAGSNPAPSSRSRARRPQPEHSTTRSSSTPGNRQRPRGHNRRNQYAPTRGITTVPQNEQTTRPHFAQSSSFAMQPESLRPPQRLYGDSGAPSSTTSGHRKPRPDFQPVRAPDVLDDAQRRFGERLYAQLQLQTPPATLVPYISGPNCISHEEQLLAPFAQHELTILDTSD